MTVPAAGAAREAAPHPRKEHMAMAPTTHEHVAAELARDYAAGDDDTRRQIAATCEEQGILAALVALALFEELRPGFIRAMQAAVADTE